MTAPSSNQIGKFFSILSPTMAVAAFSWAWTLNAEIAVLKENRLNDKSSIETANEVVKEWEGVKGKLESHSGQLRGLWDHLNDAQDEKPIILERIQRLETKIEYCCK